MLTKKVPQTRACKNTSTAVMPFLMIGTVKNGPLSAEAIFALEWKKIAIIRKNKMISITLRQIPRKKSIF